MTKDEALRLALEALKNAYWPTDSDLLPAHNIKECAEAITAIKASLEAKDEPWEKFCDSHCVWTDHHPDCRLAKDELVQVSPLQFVEMVMEKEDCIGKPIFWAEWPNKEKNT